ncbi:FUSC family protein [Burkholderia sp. TSV86]|uniref:FUSC family protein n=1 Tax=Burkholderia sp. TSV86 TaxID=1385594 RepID=UPI000753BE2C|nr:FUSC family protein [Burkholderia sp. TSV86]KVE38456.1 hypothetical protein WS68_23340 [Burkholderia sp. TSV86]
MRDTFAARIAGALNLPALRHTLAVCIPVITSYAVTGDKRWLLAAIATISVTIAVERVGVAPLGTLVHGAAIVIGFLLLSFALSGWPTFVAGCAALAATAVALSRFGARLRSLGNFVFIPSLYLTCEAAASRQPAQSLIPFLCAAMLPPVALACINTLRSAPAGQRMRMLARLHDARDLGPPVAPGDVAQTAIAVMLAVSAAAMLVEWRHIDNGQWAIWSAASVVAGNSSSAHRKLRDRTLGALLGVPSGLAIGMLLPHGTLVYILATLASIVTLVAFRHYATGFGARCACIACASWVAQQSAAIAAERVADVLLGGAIGVAFALATHRLAVPLMQRCATHPERHQVH